MVEGCLNVRNGDFRDYLLTAKPTIRARRHSNGQPSQTLNASRSAALFLGLHFCFLIAGSVATRGIGLARCQERRDILKKN
jgi:hypothetical protein